MKILFLHLLFFSLLFTSLGVAAQNQITAWKTEGENTKAQKHSTYTYDPYGRLMTVEENDKNLKTNYIYDIEGQLKRLDIYTNEGLTKIHFHKGAEPTTIIEHPVFGEQKKVSYKDERGKITEELIYHNQVLTRRILYSYTAFDSLFGQEVIDFFKSNEERKITPTISFVLKKGEKYQNPVHIKFISYFDEKTNKKIKEVKFIDDKKPLFEKYYTYNSKNMLTEVREINYQTDEVQIRWYSYDKNNVLTHMRTEERIAGELYLFTLLEYIYQENSLWQTISQTFNRNEGFNKQVTVFKEGKLIRERHYKGEKLVSTIDYQYSKL